MNKSNWHWNIEYNSNEAVAMTLLQKRRELKKTQTDVVNHINEQLNVEYTQKNISDWERGRIKKIPQDILACWAKYLGLGVVPFLSIVLPKIPLKDARPTQSVQVLEFFKAFQFVFEHFDEEWLSKDRSYSRAIKADMRELLEMYLRERDEDLLKEEAKAAKGVV